MRRALRLVLAAIVVGASACATHVAPPAPAPRSPSIAVLERREGLASYYGKEFHGKMAASGVPFNMNAMVAAHPSYPFGTQVRVTNLKNGRSTTVRIVDRGPAPRLRDEGIVIDLSRKAAQVLGFIQQGQARVRLEVLDWGNR
jgi:rare lipoprotein A